MDLTQYTVGGDYDQDVWIAHSRCETSERIDGVFPYTLSLSDLMKWATKHEAKCRSEN
jgi:hypothetical protein